MKKILFIYLSTHLAIMASPVPLPHTIELYIVSGSVVSIEEGNLALESSHKMHKRGYGSLYFKGNNAGSSQISGTLYIDEGRCMFDSSNSFGDAFNGLTGINMESRETVMADGTSLVSMISNTDDDVSLSRPIKINNSTQPASITIDLNNQSMNREPLTFTLPAIHNNGTTHQININFENTGATLMQTVITGNDYETASPNDKMIIKENVNLSTSSQSQLAPNIDMHQGSKLTITHSSSSEPFITPKITYVEPFNSCFLF